MRTPKPGPGYNGPTRGAEDAALERIGVSLAAQFGPAPPGELWFGDDAAVIRIADPRLVVATDIAVAGVHADLALLTEEDLGWRAVAATVSDIAAMGARPTHLLSSLCVAPDTDLDGLCAGVAAAAGVWGCIVVGGDLSRSAVAMASITVLGTLEDNPAEALTRSGSRAGERIFVTGPLGSSAAGLRYLRAGELAEGPSAAAIEAHRRPRARVEEGLAARRAGASALMDISDGLLLDLDRMGRSSGVGIVIESVPVDPEATVEEALSGGEDFELLIVTAHPEALLTAFKSAGLRPPVPLGLCTNDPLERLLDGARFEGRGYQHEIG